MNQSTSTQPESANSHPFSFEWNGGFSYLTYLKIKTDVSISEKQLIIDKKNYILGAFPGRTKSTEVALTNINGLSVSTKLNWFDLVFAILFAIVTLISTKLWLLLLTAFFVWRTFNSSIRMTDHRGNQIRILTGSKSAADRFVQAVSQIANTHREIAASAEKAANLAFSQPLVPTVERNTRQKIFLFAGAGIVSLGIIFALVFAKGGFDNKYVEWVRLGSVPGSTLKMAQVLENNKYFSNVVWKEVREEGNDLDNFVMYQATFSDQGVKVAVRTVFQVFGEDHFEAVEVSSDGEILHTSDWYIFLADMADRYNNATSPKQAVQAQEPEQAQPPASPTAAAPSESPAETSSPITTPKAGEVNLSSFAKWSQPESDITLPLELDGEEVELLIGLDSPNGVKVLALSDSLAQGWPLQLSTNASDFSPFDDFGELREGFSLYMKEYDFANDNVPEVVVVASDGMLETYVWAFAYNYIFTENGTSPLDLIWYGEGQSDVILEGNSILLPFGSQGLFDEYAYSDNNTFTFIKQ